MWWQWPIVMVCVGWAAWTLMRRAARMLGAPRSATGEGSSTGCGDCGACGSKSSSPAPLVSLALPPGDAANRT